MIICEAKIFEFIRYNLHQTLFWWIVLPKTINSLSPLWSDFRGSIYQHRPNLYICCKISRSIIITRKIRLLRVCSEWLNILITSYPKEAINTGTFKHVFLRESKFFKKGYIIHSNVVRSSHRKVQNKHIGIYFFTAPIYHRSVMTGSYKNNKVKICFILPQSFWKKGRMSGLI